MKLTNLQLINYRCFESLSIDFEDQLTVLVAKNGVGKTAVLDAIAVALSPFLRGIDTAVGKGFKPEDARLLARTSSRLTYQETKLISMEPQFPINLTAKGVIDGHSVEWARELTGSKTKTTLVKAKTLTSYGKKLQQHVRDGEEIILPVLVHYGIGRLWNPAQVSMNDKKSVESRSRLYGYHDTLNANSNYKAFEQWFTEASLVEANYYASKIFNWDVLENLHGIDSSSFPRRSMDDVKKAINQCLSTSGWEGLRYDFTFRELVLRHDNDEIPVSRLSDGVKAALALTADIAYRCVQLNPHLSLPFEETDGIVLIDEIDVHLHPAWQQTILGNLTKAFPKIQFIVTTHSPQVLTTVKPECIRILSENGVFIPTINTYGEESKDTLEDIMGTHSRPPIKEADLLGDYLKHINQGDIDSSDVIRWRQELEQIFGSDYSKLTLADMVINKWRAKRGIA